MLLGTAASSASVPMPRLLRALLRLHHRGSSSFAALALALALVAGAFAAAGCAGRTGGAPPWRGPADDRGKPTTMQPTIRDFVPSGAAAPRYNAPVDGTATESSPLADAAEAAVVAAAQQAGVPVPPSDGRLAAAATDLAGFMAPDELLSYEVIEFALHHHGLIEPSPEIILVQGDERAPEAMTEALAARLPEVMAGAQFARLGIGVAGRAGGLAFVVVALQESHLDTEPVAKQVELGDSVRLRGRLRAPFGDPAIYVTGADGQVDRPKVVRDGGSGFRVEVRCAAPAGERKVEVIGKGPQGVSVLANFPVYCGQRPPARLTVDTHAADEPYQDAADAERVIFRRLNQDRAQAGLSSLTWDDRAAAVARAHSADMEKNRYVAHVSPTTGTAADRARAAKLATPLVLENVARAYGPGEAQRGFMESPGHRANVLSQDATHVGIGVALGAEVQGRRELYVTQLYFRVPPKVDNATARKAVRDRLVDVRARAKKVSLRSDADLEGLAQTMAEDLAAGRDQAAVQSKADRKMDALGHRFASITTVVLIAGDAEAIGLDAVADDDARAWGLGVAQGPSAEIGERALFVVVLLARPRPGANPTNSSP
jgi:uncharacterized protein YkwD